MIWRVILFWLLAANLAFANLPRFSSVVSVTFCSSQLWGFHYDAVNSARALTYGDFTFASTNNTLISGVNTFTIIAQNAHGVAVTNNLTVNLPASVNLQYDANGNLTNDGTRSFFYDAENQLTNVNVPGTWQAVFVYDGLNRRRIERDYTWQSSAWLLTNETHFVDDGMQIVQERDTNNNPLVTYTRGLDLSQSLAGAGGIGGLLARTGTNGSVFYHSDGAGNITAMQDTNQNIVARYEYEGFGRTIGMWGTMASANRMRFSSKWYFTQGDMYDFGYRWYPSGLPHWLTRDPSGEAGGINLTETMGNNPVNNVDPFGLDANAVIGPNGSAVGPSSGSLFDSGGGNVPNGPFYRPSSYSPGPYDNPFTATYYRGLEALGDLGGFLDYLSNNYLNWGGAGFNATDMLASMGPEFNEMKFSPELKTANKCERAAEGGGTTLFRAVNPAELSDLSANGGVFRNLGFAEGKYFSTTAEGAGSYARQTFGTGLYEGPYTVVQTTIPSSSLTPIMGATVDRGISTIVVPNNLLPSLSPANPLPFIPLKVP